MRKHASKSVFSRRPEKLWNLLLRVEVVLALFFPANPSRVGTKFRSSMSSTIFWDFFPESSFLLSLTHNVLGRLSERDGVFIFNFMQHRLVAPPGSTSKHPWHSRRHLPILIFYLQDLFFLLAFFLTPSLILSHFLCCFPLPSPTYSPVSLSLFICFCGSISSFGVITPSRLCFSFSNYFRPNGRSVILQLLIIKAIWTDSSHPPPLSLSLSLSHSLSLSLSLSLSANSHKNQRTHSGANTQAYNAQA